MKAKDEKPISLTDVEVGELIREVQGRGYYIAKTPVVNSGQTFKGDLKRFRGTTYKFGVVSDSHLCSRYQQLTYLWDFYRILAKRHIDTCFHCGDLVDGEGVYRTQVYETFVHGADGQTEYAIANYPKVKGVQTHIISGNHDLSFMDKGFNVVQAVCKERADMTYLGDYLAYVTIDSIRIALMHGFGAGTTYARSYRLQKYIEAFQTDMKPNMLFLGHFHNANILSGYRNVEGILMPCLGQSQSPFLARLALFPHLAGLIVEITTDPKGLARVKYEWIHFLYSEEK